MKTQQWLLKDAHAQTHTCTQYTRDDVKATEKVTKGLTERVKL